MEDDDVMWLMNSTDPWVNVVEKWKSTYEQRLVYKNIPILEYINKFPALKTKLGYTLVSKIIYLHKQCFLQNCLVISTLKENLLTPILTSKLQIRVNDRFPWQQALVKLTHKFDILKFIRNPFSYCGNWLFA